MSRARSKRTHLAERFALDVYTDRPMVLRVISLRRIYLILKRLKSLW